MADWLTWRLISRTEPDSSSAAAATVRTLAAASSEAAATMVDWCLVSEDEDDSTCAADGSSLAALETAVRNKRELARGAIRPLGCNR
jgi:hypothetical protein